MNTARGRWAIAATVLGSGIVGIDATVVNVALPVIGRGFHTSLATLQWTVNAYTLTLSAFLLIGGALGDLYGRRRVFMLGVSWFAFASLLSGVSPTSGVLVLARALQGMGAALLMPGSLAIIQSSFHPDDRARAIGAWAGLGGVALAIGPLLGGWLIEVSTWRVIFLINLPLVVLVLWVARRHVPESRDPGASRHVDVVGALLAAVGLAGLVYGLIAAPDSGWTAPMVLAALIVGVAALAAFVVVERRQRQPMLPLDIFRSRQFTGANLATVLIYGALSGSLFLIPTQLQQSLHYSPLGAGLALLPITLILLVLSSRAGWVSHRIGPRIPMTVGPIVGGVGLAMLSMVQPGTTYLRDFTPGVLIFSLGLAFTVTPLTATVLAAAPDKHAGIASAINNDAARAAGLIAVAALPVAVGLSGSSYLHPAIFSQGYRHAMWISGALCAAGGVLAWATIRGRGTRRASERETRPAIAAGGPRAAGASPGASRQPQPAPARAFAARPGRDDLACSQGVPVTGAPSQAPPIQAPGVGDPGRAREGGESAGAARQDAPRHRLVAGEVDKVFARAATDAETLGDCVQSEPQLHLVEPLERALRVCRHVSAGGQ
jgi:EmrB/QacA subfamily drug resistance transporter